MQNKNTIVHKGEEEFVLRAVRQILIGQNFMLRSYYNTDLKKWGYTGFVVIIIIIIIIIWLLSPLGS